MSEISYYTPEGLENLKQEIKHLETVERPKISQQIGEARDKGDLSENAEYDAAKEAQGMLEARISKLKNCLRNPAMGVMTPSIDLKVPPPMAKNSK